MTENPKGFFFGLTPDKVLEAVESAGLICTGRCMALNSFENRVYDVEIEENDNSNQKEGQKKGWRIVKFYRPGRWTQEQIAEEHLFLKDLAEAEIPAIGPLPFADGSTLRKVKDTDIYFAIFPKVGGRAPDELTDEQLARIGRLLGRIHNVGKIRPANHRIKIDPATYGLANLELLISQNWLSSEILPQYQACVKKICELSQPWFDSARYQRIHGDCHFGNLLWNQLGPFFLDFDDMVCGPPIQDIWLLTPGRDEETRRQREVLLSGYEQMTDFDRQSMRLIEPLRALRFVHFSAWIAKRWDDPAFPAVFPAFGTHQYWSDELRRLREQLDLIS